MERLTDETLYYFGRSCISADNTAISYYINENNKTNKRWYDGNISVEKEKKMRVIFSISFF